MLVSYAQNREDLFLYALLGDGPGFYVDVGANHPTVHSVTRFFYERGWHGINIEPNANLTRQLAIERPRDINLNLGISDQSGLMTLRVFTDADGLSTFEPDLMTRQAAAHPRFEDRPVNVECLASVLDQHGVSVIDFMKIDTEGHEMRVLASNDWSLFRPRCLVIEGGAHDTYIPYLLERGYHNEFFDGLNFYFVAEECRHQMTIMRYAERVLSQGMMPGELADRIASLEAKISSLASGVADGSTATSPPIETPTEAVHERPDSQGGDIRHARSSTRKKRLRRRLADGWWAAWSERFSRRKSEGA